MKYTIKRKMVIAFVIVIGLLFNVYNAFGESTLFDALRRRITGSNEQQAHAQQVSLVGIWMENSGNRSIRLTRNGLSYNGFERLVTPDGNPIINWGANFNNNTFTWVSHTQDFVTNFRLNGHTLTLGLPNRQTVTFNRIGYAWFPGGAASTLDTRLVGTWNGNLYAFGDRRISAPVTFIFNSNGTFEEIGAERFRGRYAVFRNEIELRMEEWLIDGRWERWTPSSNFFEFRLQNNNNRLQMGNYDLRRR